MRGIVVILIMVLVTVFILGACAKPTVYPVLEPPPTSLPSPPPTGPETVSFPDENLEAAIRDALSYNQYLWFGIL
jgi:hypothetical protein